MLAATVLLFVVALLVGSSWRVLRVPQGDLSEQTLGKIVGALTMSAAIGAGGFAACLGASLDLAAGSAFAVAFIESIIVFRATRDRHLDRP